MKPRMMPSSRTCGKMPIRSSTSMRYAPDGLSGRGPGGRGRSGGWCPIRTCRLFQVPDGAPPPAPAPVPPGPRPLGPCLLLGCGGGGDGQLLDDLVFTPLPGVFVGGLEHEVERLLPVTLRVALHVAGGAGGGLCLPG